MVNISFWHNFYTYSIKALFYIVPFLPLYIANSMLFPYITGRNFAFRIIVEIALVFWLGLAALDQRYRPELSWLMRAVLIFIAIVFMADIFGASFYRSFWSNYERMEGFLMLIHMAAFFVMAGAVLRLKDWRIFANLVVVASFGVACWGLLQQLGILRSLQGGNRVEGSIGNPSYLAAYLMLASFISLILLAYARARWLKYLYGGLVAFELLIIYFSATRGTTLAVIGAVVLFALLYLLLTRADEKFKRQRALALIAAAVILVIAGIFWSMRNTEFVKSYPALRRLTSTSFSSQTIESRLLIWQIALKGAKERPLLGWGQENFNLVFNKYFEPRLWQQEPWFDRAHNIVLDWITNAGILGLSAYLSLFAAAFYALWALYQKGNISAGIFSLAITGFTAHFAQNLTVFDNFNTYFIFFGALAFLHSYSSQNQSIEFASNQVSVKKSINNYERNALGISLSAFLFAFLAGASVLYFVNFKPIRQAKMLINTLTAVRSDAPPKAVLPLFAETLSQDTFGNREVVEQLAQYGIKIADTANIANDDKKAVLAEVVKKLELETKRMPEDIRYSLFLASLGYFRMAFFDQQYIPKAEHEFKKVISMSPTKQNLYIGLVQLYLGVGEYEKAFQYAKQMHEIDVAFPDGAFFYAVSSIYAKHFDIAEKIIAERPEFRSSARGVMLANAYAAVQNYKPMASLYLDIIKSEPNNPQYHANLAAVYAQLGDKSSAKKEAEEAIRLDPTFKEQGEAFIKVLGF